MQTKTSRELSLIYDGVGEFINGLAVAHKDEKWFHIRTDGTPVYEQKYDYVGNFTEGLAKALKNDKWFHIRPDGAPVE